LPARNPSTFAEIIVFPKCSYYTLAERNNAGLYTVTWIDPFVPTVRLFTEKVCKIYMTFVIRVPNSEISSQLSRDIYNDG
jgi:hypothetical protein